MIQPLTKQTSYAVEVENGQVRFIEANRVRIRRGRLVFLTGLQRIAGVVEAGQWRRMVEGLTPDDLRGNE